MKELIDLLKREIDKTLNISEKEKLHLWKQLKDLEEDELQLEAIDRAINSIIYIQKRIYAD